jgi:hypothetical protein
MHRSARVIMKMCEADCDSRERSKSEAKRLLAAIELAQDNPSNSIKDKEYTNTPLPADPKVVEMKEHILSREGVESVEFIAKGGQGTAFLISMSDGTKKFGKVIDIGDINKLINNRAEFRETLAGNLNHKRIPRSHVTESFNDNTQYLFIRDYVTGVSLKELIQQKGKLSSEEAKGYLRQGLEVLEYLHDGEKHPEVGQVIHRDVKPSNIIIDGDGKLFLVDFGCAHFRTPNEQSMTKYNMGTEGYKSGEQQIGGACASSDLYSLGITILEGLIADRPLLVNKLKENWFRDAIGQPFEIPSDLEICPQLRRVLQKMIKANHAERYKSASEAAAALDRPESVGIFDSLKGIFNWSWMFNLNRSSQGKEDRAELAVAAIKSVDGHQAVIGQIRFSGRRLDTLLTEGSFNRSREDQIAYAKSLGYRMATREEHRAYVDDLLAKEADGSINKAEAIALKVYRRFDSMALPFYLIIRDTQGGLGLDGRRFHSHDNRWGSQDFFSDGALFVRASAESRNWWSIFGFLVPFGLRQGSVIHDAASTVPAEKLAQASSNFDEAVKTATHGFKQVTAPDGIAAIEVKITRPTGEEVTCLLSEGAKGILYSKLADYGKNQLTGASLLTQDDFEAVVTSLFNAIKGLKVVNKVLQTRDEALKQAYTIVTEGVRRDLGFSWAKFDLDSEGGVSGHYVDAYALSWYVNLYRFACAAFVSPPAE